MRINLFKDKYKVTNRPREIFRKISDRAKAIIWAKPVADTFCSTAIKPKIHKICVPITNEEEYKRLLGKLKHIISNNGDYAYFTEKDLSSYKNIDLKEHGLIPYCGFDDCHSIINMYLSGRLTENAQREVWYNLPIDLDTIPDVVRVLEYSLNVLDKKHGAYSGIVYRQGIMSETPNQYVSTTLNPHIAANLLGSWGNFKGNKKYSIIQVNNGHRIVDFQKKANVVFADSEKEILLPFRNEYEKLSDNELSTELRQAKENFAKCLFKGADKLFTGEEIQVNGYTKNDVLNMIDVFVQK